MSKILVPRRVVVCGICGKDKLASECRIFESIRPSVAELVAQRYPKLKVTDYVCRRDLVTFRQKHIENVLLAEKGELTKIDHEVIKSLINHETLARNIDAQIARKRTIGIRISDAITAFSGSMLFVCLHIVWFIAWILVNDGHFGAGLVFDPFPYGLLTMVVSLEAIFLATFIMISQNVQSKRSELRAENDYKVNLKAELQIRQLHEKIDYLTQQQWHRLLEMQEMEIDLLQEGRRSKKKR